jgi:hypothetical protein
VSFSKGNYIKKAGSLFWRNFNQMVSSVLDYSSKIISLGDYNIDFPENLPTEIADIINLYGIPPPYVFLSNLNGLKLKPGITNLLVGTR